MLARNIELKARASDLALARETAQRLATVYRGALRQRDTYFRCPQGRLKLREIEGEPTQLIAYQRPDDCHATASDYILAEITDAGLAVQLRAALTAVLGVAVVVEKSREVFLHHNVRIHLDDVFGLGPFIEFEAVIDGEIDDAAGHEQLVGLQREFGIVESDLIAVSYSDLLLKRQADAG
jgi:predicted adenylyl cyclase CyaB